MNILCYLLGILNAMDGWLTYFGLQNGYIRELNPFMNWVWIHYPDNFLSLKWLLSILIITLGFVFQPKTHFLKWKFTISAVTVIYTIVLMLHVRWILLLLGNV